MDKEAQKRLKDMHKRVDRRMMLLFQMLLEKEGPFAAISVAGQMAYKSLAFGLITVEDQGGNPGVFVNEMLVLMEKFANQIRENKDDAEGAIEVSNKPFTCRPLH